MYHRLVMADVLLRSTSPKAIHQRCTASHIAICEANFLCDVLLTVQNDCAVNEKDLKC